MLLAKRFSALLPLPLLGCGFGHQRSEVRNSPARPLPSAFPASSPPWPGGWSPWANRSPRPREINWGPRGAHEQIHMVVNIWGSAWTSARRDGAVGRAAARQACPNLNYRRPSAEQRLGFFKKLRLSCRVDFAVPDLGAARAAAFTSSPGVFCASGARRSAAAGAR